MKFRDLRFDDFAMPGVDTGAGGSGAGVAALRAEASQLADVGNRVIRRTLSTDSEKFNRIGRQQDGQ